MQYLKIIHWNCFKMTQSRLIELTNFLSETKPDIMCLNEVKYSHEEANLFLRFDSYYVYYKPRIKNPSDGGGVAILVRDVIPHTRIMSGLADNLENVGIRVENGSNFLNLIALYSPARTLSFEAVKGYLDLGSELLLLGDLNANSAAIGCKRQDYNRNVLDQISCLKKLARIVFFSFFGVIVLKYMLLLLFCFLKRTTLFTLFF